MDLSLQDVFDRARASGAWLTPAEADLVFAAAVRVASENGAPPVPGRILLAPDGHLSVSQVDPPERRAYLAPELLAADPPRRTEPRVQV
ncbi:MAG: hypothetical protein JST92_24110, partial [Deltaproteobacteria bacterium]|nr:hypothetical protein [Deltaproteobacteria bacterium]